MIKLRFNVKKADFALCSDFPEFSGCATFSLWTTTSTLPFPLLFISPSRRDNPVFSHLNFLTLWFPPPPPSFSPSCIMSNYRSRRVSMGSSSVPSHQSLCLCLLVYLLLLFSALSWRPDGTQVSAPRGDSYCKLSLHPQSFKTLPNWDFIDSVCRIYLTYLTQIHTAWWCQDEGKKNITSWCKSVRLGFFSFFKYTILSPYCVSLSQCEF